MTQKVYTSGDTVYVEQGGGFVVLREGSIATFAYHLPSAAARLVHEDDSDSYDKGYREGYGDGYEDGFSNGFNDYDL